MQTMLARDTIGRTDSCLVYLLVSDFGLEWFGENVLKRKQQGKKTHSLCLQRVHLSLQILLQRTTVDPW